MSPASLYFLSLLFSGLALVPAMAHLLELPHKIRLSPEDYLTVQQIYRGWALLGAVVIVALLSTAALTVTIRRERAAFVFALLGCLCIALTQVVFWAYTFPVNRATRDWTVLPDDWAGLRRRWEYSHAASAVLNLIALASLILSVLMRQVP
jgi:Domain of unknown function (DUF1772)